MSINTKTGAATNIQAENAVAVTGGGDATVFAVPSTLFIGTTGNVTVTTSGGQTGVVFKNLPSGSILPVLVTSVTSATAADIVRLY